MTKQTTPPPPMPLERAAFMLTPRFTEGLEMLDASTGKPAESNAIRFLHFRPDKPTESAWTLCIRDQDTERLLAYVRAVVDARDRYEAALNAVIALELSNVPHFVSEAADIARGAKGEPIPDRGDPPQPIRFPFHP